jgi:hypothetical protein
MSVIASRPRHSCTGFPEFSKIGDVVRCVECGQHWVRGWRGYWEDISPRKARSLIRRYEHERARIEKKLSKGPYDPLEVSR